MNTIIPYYVNTMENMHLCNTQEVSTCKISVETEKPLFENNNGVCYSISCENKKIFFLVEGTIFRFNPRIGSTQYISLNDTQFNHLLKLQKRLNKLGSGLERQFVYKSENGYNYLKCNLNGKNKKYFVRAFNSDNAEISIPSLPVRLRGRFLIELKAYFLNKNTKKVYPLLYIREIQHIEETHSNLISMYDKKHNNSEQDNIPL